MLSLVQLFVTPWTVAHQALPSMGFSRQESQSGLPLPSPGDRPNPGIKRRSPTLQADSLPAEPQGKPKNSGMDSLVLFICAFIWMNFRIETTISLSLWEPRTRIMTVWGNCGLIHTGTLYLKVSLLYHPVPNPLLLPKGPTLSPYFSSSVPRCQTFSHKVLTPILLWRKEMLSLLDPSVAFGLSVESESVMQALETGDLDITVG